MRNELLFATLRGLALPAALLAFTTAYLFEALDLGSPLRYGVPSAAFMPLVLSGAMYLALTIVIVGRVREHLRQARGTAARVSTEPLIALVRPGLAALATGLYVALFAQLGFVVATVLYVFALLSLFGYRDGRTVSGQAWRVVTSLATAGLVYAFFTGLFGVQLPTLEGVV